MTITVSRPFATNAVLHVYMSIFMYENIQWCS